jgi:hypothetical protein
MNLTFFRRGASRRGVVLFSIALAAGAGIAARPAAPGMTFRARMSVTPPEIPGMPPQTPVLIVGHGAALGPLSRLDLDTVQGQLPLSVGDFMLTLDSGRVVTVSPSTKTYIEGLGALGGLPPDVLAQATITNVNVTTEKLGAGETIQGYATEKVRITIAYSIAVMGAAMNTMTTTETWVAKLPAEISTPFDGGMPKEMLQGPTKELAEKSLAARKSLPGTPIKTINTTSITGPMSISTVATIELVDLKSADVDPAMLKVPEGYTKKP